MEGENSVISSIIDELFPGDLQGDQNQGESGDSWRNIDGLHFTDIQGDQKEG